MNTSIIRGRTLTFNRRPNSATDNESYSFIEDGAVFITNGIISKLDSFADEFYRKQAIGDSGGLNP